MCSSDFSGGKNRDRKETNTETLKWLQSEQRVESEKIPTNQNKPEPGQYLICTAIFTAVLPSMHTKRGKYVRNKKAFQDVLKKLRFSVSFFPVRQK